MAMGRKDLRRMMEQVQQLQQQMAAAQEELAGEEFRGTAGGGVVEVTVNGRGEVLAVRISPEVIDPEDPELLGDLVMAATNQALRAVNEAAGDRMGGMMGGLDLPPGLLG